LIKYIESRFDHEKNYLYKWVMKFKLTL
jgi:hypothetical protein